MKRSPARWIVRAVAVLALLTLALPAAAQEEPVAEQEEAVEEEDGAAQWQPRTGDDWIDARLRDMGDYAVRYRDAFVDEIVRYHEAPRALVEEALADGSMHPGDVYFACALARATGRNCRAVIDAWRADPSAGWEAVVEQLGAVPGAGIYRRIRGDITESYVRWARPLDSGTPPPA